MEPDDVSLCLEDPSIDVDLQVTADAAALYEVFVRRQDLLTAIRSEKAAIRGSRSLAREFPRWMAWSPYAATA
ncbi:MAG: hypothetical protein ACE5MI_11645 [Acidimicrobiia bacterium]